MSAFIHHPEHIISIVASAAQLNLGPITVGRTVYSLHIPADCDKLCRLLYAANVRSVNSRYHERTRLKMAGRYHTAGNYSRMNAAALCKAIDSLEYQSCERSDYQKSAACSLLIQLRLRAGLKAVGLYKQAEDTAAYQSADVWSIAQ